MAEEAEDKTKCMHETVTCDCCGKQGSPSQLLASRPRKRSAESADQSRRAGQISAEKRHNEAIERKKQEGQSK